MGNNERNNCLYTRRRASVLLFFFLLLLLTLLCLCRLQALSCLGVFPPPHLITTLLIMVLVAQDFCHKPRQETLCVPAK